MRIEILSKFVLFSSFIAVAACSGEQGDPDLLTAEYMAGSWCYEQYEVNGDVEEQDITYTFNADGSLLYQTDSDAPVDQAGSFTIGRQGLEILPAFEPFPPMRARTIEADRLILLNRDITLTWTRGACGE